MENNCKEVYFNEYCKTCEYENLTEEESPCDECLSNPVNLHSHKPVCWKEKKNKNSEG